MTILRRTASVSCDHWEREAGQGAALAATTLLDMINSKPQIMPCEIRSNTSNLAPLAVTVLRDEILSDKDILCLRGPGGLHRQANVAYRRRIASRKERFDSLSAPEGWELAESLWGELNAEGYSFLKPTGGRYEVLDGERCVHKCYMALRDIRYYRANPAKVATRSVKKKQKRDQEVGNQLKVVEAEVEFNLEVKFNDVARAAILQLLSRPELAEAAENWGKHKEKRQLLFEQQLLLRYQAAALNGMSVREFSGRILPVLLEEVGVGTDMVVS